MLCTIFERNNLVVDLYWENVYEKYNVFSENIHYLRNAFQYIPALIICTIFHITFTPPHQKAVVNSTKLVFLNMILHVICRAIYVRPWHAFISLLLENMNCLHSFHVDHQPRIVHDGLLDQRYHHWKSDPKRPERSIFSSTETFLVFKRLQILQR